MPVFCLDCWFTVEVAGSPAASPSEIMRLPDDAINCLLVVTTSSGTAAANEASPRTRYEVLLFSCFPGMVPWAAFYVMVSALFEVISVSWLPGLVEALTYGPPTVI